MNFVLIFMSSLVLTCSMTTINGYETLPDFLQICQRSDPNLDLCILNSIQNLSSRFGNGIPELYMPPLEPLNVPEVKIDQSSGPIFIHSIYENILINGLSDFHIKEVRADIEKDKYLLKLEFPNIRITANYKIDGKLMMMPLKGQGNLQGNFSDVNVMGFLKGERYLKNNRIQHIRIKDIIIRYTIGGLNINLDNLFNGEQKLGATMNTFLNDNWKAVGAEVKPVMQDAMSAMLKSTTDKFFDMFSFDQLFPV